MLSLFGMLPCFMLFCVHSHSFNVLKHFIASTRFSPLWFSVTRDTDPVVWDYISHIYRSNVVLTLYNFWYVRIKMKMFSPTFDIWKYHPTSNIFWNIVSVFPTIQDNLSCCGKFCQFSSWLYTLSSELSLLQLLRKLMTCHGISK